MCVTTCSNRVLRCAPYVLVSSCHWLANGIHSTDTSIDFGLGSSVLGTVTVSTPSRVLALMPAGGHAVWE